MNAVTTRDAWDACADAYAEHRALWSPIEDLTFALLRPQADERILDVGCGPGTLAVRLARAGARATAIDLAPRMVELTRRRAAVEGVAVAARAMDAERLTFPDASQDAVVSCLTFHLLPDPARAAREAARVLAPGGRVAVTVWGAPLPGSPSAALLAALPRPPAANASQAALPKTFAAAGFEDVEERSTILHLRAPRSAWIASFLDGSPLSSRLDALGGRGALTGDLQAALGPFADSEDVIEGPVDIRTLLGRCRV